MSRTIVGYLPFMASTADQTTWARAVRWVVAPLAAISLAAGCGSAPPGDDSDDPAEDVGTDSTEPGVEGTVTPRNDVGVGGGVPIDNLNPEVEPGADDVDGDGAPDG